MAGTKSYFFCGIGGSGMLPLACILRGRGHAVAGSDRALDQARLADKFAFLARLGIDLFPQDGSGLTSADQILVTSAAVEDTVPDVVKAKTLGVPRVTRPELLALLFNDAPFGIAVGGTSGKSTTTGMIAWILHEAKCDPTVMNGAVMKNFASENMPFASALAGDGEIFVSEVDESDGSIALFRPDIALLGNITLDHKSLDELRGLFFDFAAKAQAAILNLDDDETALLADRLDPDRLTTFSFASAAADLVGSGLVEDALAVSFDVADRRSGESASVRLGVPGHHNAANALAAIAAARAAGVGLIDSADSLARFTGIARRFDVVGTAGGVTVIDDFAHNPDKIAATFATLRVSPGRLLLFFQPHGYGPLKAMRRELVDCFARNLADDDVLILSDPAYFGGTTDRSVGSAEIVEAVRAAGRRAEHIADRHACGERLVALARPGDRIVVMGARDDTLSQFARQILEKL